MSQRDRAAKVLESQRVLQSEETLVLGASCVQNPLEGSEADL
jgi:hypothetical protein